MDKHDSYTLNDALKDKKAFKKECFKKVIGLKVCALFFFLVAIFSFYLCRDVAFKFFMTFIGFLFTWFFSSIARDKIKYIKSKYTRL